jgi:very-short-patch-repair endonuclease
MPNTSEEILNLLRIRARLKAREIASALGITNREVNAKLYGELKNLVEPDSQYQWSLRNKGSAITAEAKVPAARSNSDLARLCRYYLDCLAHDRDVGVSAFAANSFKDLDYAELESLPFCGNNPAPVFSASSAQRLLNKVRRDRGKLVLYLGYPVRLRFVRSKKSDWTGYMVDPVFLFPFDVDRSGTTEPELTDEPPTINTEVLKRLTNLGTGNLIDEAVQLTDSLGLNNPAADLPDLDEVFYRLRQVRPEWDWIEETDPYALSTGTPISECTAEGIYNRAILISGERSPYTQGLENELAKLAEVQPAQLSGTVLDEWLHGHMSSSPLPGDNASLEVLPLNTEQRQAVLQGLSNRLTVITGPPGTGKSQVVASLLINAAWQGQKVLFASKNNRAVDVVESRVNSLGPRPILLRLGAKEYQSRLSEYLTDLLASPSSPNDSDEYKDCLRIHEELKARFDSLTESESSIVQLRNAIDQFEKEVEGARRECSAELARKISKGVLGTISELSDSIDRADRSRVSVLTRILWPFVRAARVRDVAMCFASASEIAEQFKVSFPNATFDEKLVDSWRQSSDKLLEKIKLVLRFKDYLQALDQLTACKSLEQIALEKAILTEEIAANSLTLWKLWLSIQPGRMSQSDRKLLGEYASLLRLISEATEGGASRQVYRRYYETLSKVAGTLSCWAVTSLSTRGRVPFEPGFFDIVIIDEASQCDIASALPLLFRAKRAVIIGDPKQLKHISSLPKSQDQTLLAKHELIDTHSGWSYAASSLFDRAQTLSKVDDVVSLRDHHRSHAEIISFSNHNFYGDKLRIATHYENLRRVDGQPVLRWIDVRGQVVRPASGGAVNEIEARAVVAELERLVLHNRYLGSIGVVTPFTAQVGRIRDLVNQHDLLSRELASRDFLVHTAHGFQGDERDLIVFSPTVGAGTPDGCIHFLSNNDYLFNVAITRARAGLTVVGDRATARACGVEYLKKFANYVGNSETSSTEGDEATRHLGPEYPAVAKPECVSDWERLLYRALYCAGLRPIPQYPVDQYVLDFALLGDDGQHLDIEVDGERYHRNWDGELCRRDQIRNQRLIELGWDVLRFWVYQIRDDMDGCVERVRLWKSAGTETERDSVV